MKTYLQPTFELCSVNTEDVISTSVFKEGIFSEYDRIDFSQLS